GAEQVDADLARDLVALFRRDVAPDLALGPGLALRVDGPVAREDEQVADAHAGDIVAGRLRRRREGDAQFLDPSFRAHGGLLVRGVVMVPGMRGVRLRAEGSAAAGPPGGISRD